MHEVEQSNLSPILKCEHGVNDYQPSPTNLLKILSKISFNPNNSVHHLHTHSFEFVRQQTMHCSFEKASELFWSLLQKG